MSAKPWHRIKRPAYWRTIETEHLRLEPQNWWNALKLDFKLSRDRDARIKMFGSDRPHSTFRVLRQFRRPNGCSRHIHAIINKADGTLIGFHRVSLHTHRKGALMIVMLRRDATVRGFAKEARTALLRHFVTVAGVELFIGEVNARNFASVQLYNQLGFTRIATLHNTGYDPQNNRVQHALLFELYGEALERFMAKTDPEQAPDRRDKLESSSGEKPS